MMSQLRRTKRNSPGHKIVPQIGVVANEKPRETRKKNKPEQNNTSRVQVQEPPCITRNGRMTRKSNTVKQVLVQITNLEASNMKVNKTNKTKPTSSTVKETNLTTSKAKMEMKQDCTGKHLSATNVEKNNPRTRKRKAGEATRKSTVKSEPQGSKKTKDMKKEATRRKCIVKLIPLSKPEENSVKTRKTPKEATIPQCTVKLTPISLSSRETSDHSKSHVLQKSNDTLKPNSVLKKPMKTTSRSRAKVVTSLDKSSLKNNKSNTEKSIAKRMVPCKSNLKSANKEEVPLIRKLRRRNDKKYAESSLESTRLDDEPKEKTRMPIYNQQINNEKQTKRKVDLYEFDSDSEKKKRKKRKLEDSSLDEYNKTIQNILKNISNKAKIRKKKIIFCDKKKIRKGRMENAPKKQETNNNQQKMKPAHVKNGVSKEVEFNKLKNLEILDTEKATLQRQNITNGNCEIAKAAKISSISKNHQENNIESDWEGDDLTPDNDLGFSAPGTIKSASKIKIVSNIRLQPSTELNFSLGSPTYFRNSKPNANSTMIIKPNSNSTPVNNVLTPWRFNQVNMRRNPHFITLKQSALPCISQEMVMDHTIVDKLEDLSKTVPKTPVKKSPLQKTITEYFSGNVENKENSQASLFDIDQFSPIKNYNRSTKIGSVKRKILGEVHNNIIDSLAASLPVQNLEESQVHDSGSKKPSQNITYFDFDSFDKENSLDNVLVKNKDDRPFRLSININDKKYKGKQRKKKVQEAESVVASDEESDLNESSDLEDEVGRFKLFEDFTSTQDRLELHDTILKKKKKGSRKKKKEVRTEEEVEEAEKWAAEFNSMCEEIEQFPLEIE